MRIRKLLAMVGAAAFLTAPLMFGQSASAADVVNSRGTFAMTPLHYAIMAESPGETRVLLAHGANVNARDGEGQTALMLAAQEGRADLVKMLLDDHARVDIKDEDGMTAVEWASDGGNTEVVDMLLTAK